jgi:hypothetical protein
MDRETTIAPLGRQHFFIGIFPLASSVVFKTRIDLPLDHR